MLSAALVSKVTAPGHYHAGHGLILRVTRAGTKQWVQRLRIRGKRRELGLGGYPLVTLAMAREAALANRRKVHAGGDPLAEKQRARPTSPGSPSPTTGWSSPRWRPAGWWPRRCERGGGVLTSFSQANHCLRFRDRRAG